MFSVEVARKEFDACIDAVLGELKRVIRITDFDRKDLRDLAVQRLMQFASAAKLISQADQFRSASPGVSKFFRPTRAGGSPGGQLDHYRLDGWRRDSAR
jgi:hypothetical protein